MATTSRNPSIFINKQHDVTMIFENLTRVWDYFTWIFLIPMYWKEWIDASFMKLWMMIQYNYMEMRSTQKEHVFQIDMIE